MVAAALVVAAVCTRLGIWQLDRLEQRRERNAAMTRSLALPVLDLGDSLAAIVRDSEPFAYRRVIARLEPTPLPDFLIRGRSNAGIPGVNVISVRRIRADTAVLVNRGWLPAADAVSVDPRSYPEQAELAVSGILFPSPTARGGDSRSVPVNEANILTFASLPLDSLRSAYPGVLLGLYLQQLEPASAEGLPRRLDPPTTDEGPHLGYAFQWFSFAAIALIGMTVLLVRERSSRQ